MAYGTHAPPAPDELAGQPGPHRPARKRSDPRFLRALPRRGPRTCRAGSSSSTRCTRFSRAAAFAGTTPRPTRATAFEYGSTNEGDAAQTWRRSIFYHMLEHGHEELPIDLADCDPLNFGIDQRSRRERSQAFRGLRAPVRRGRHHGPDGLRLFLLDDPARRGLWRAGPGGVARPGAGAGACDQDPRRRPISRETLGRVYLGRDAAEQVLRGRISRGVTERINAVLWFSDLRGSTAISESIEPGRDHPVPQRLCAGLDRRHP